MVLTELAAGITRTREWVKKCCRRLQLFPIGFLYYRETGVILTATTLCSCKLCSYKETGNYKDREDNYSNADKSDHFVNPVLVLCEFLLIISPVVVKLFQFLRNDLIRLTGSIFQ